LEWHAEKLINDLKLIDQGRREDLNGGGFIRSFCVTTDQIAAIAAKLENIETVKL
jgi:hypothetical protein